jgi:hypothetical protein
MPDNLFLLLPLLGGYIFAKNWNRTKWYSARWEKERLLINSAISGLFFTGIAYLFIHAQDSLTCVRFLPCFPRWPMHLEGVSYLGMTILASLIASVAWIPLNVLWTLTKQEKRIIKREGTLLDILVDDSARNRKGVLITLKSGKVYAGIVLSAASPGHSRPMIKVLPTYSGYRNKKTHRIVPTTNYSQSIQDIDKDCGEMFNRIEEKREEAARIQRAIKAQPDTDKEERMKLLKREANDIELELIDLIVKKDDLGILIPVDQIVTISLYHPDIYTKYFVPLEKGPPQIGK